MALPPSGAPKKRRGRGGCCGCLVVLILLLGGSLWLARKWAPNHLNRGLSWSRTQLVAKYPVLDRWLPQAPGAPPPTVFEPPKPTPTPGASPAPVQASPAPELAATPLPTALPSTGPATELLVGSGAEAKLGQTVQVRYGGTKPAQAPERFMVGASEVDAALESAVRGMKVGGRRKLGELEIELLKVL